MNIEGLTLSLLTRQLNSQLLGSKIYKVFMPTPTSLLLMVKRERDTLPVFADMSAFGPIIYLPDSLPENPDVPPSFCMLLRKHLEEGRINKITQSGLDRIITFEIDLLGASSKIITKKLIFELTGSTNNIILTQDDLIIDSLKHIGSQQSSYRTILPGKEYTVPPQQNGCNLLNDEADTIIEKVLQTPAANIKKALIAATVGIGNFTADELLHAADILPQQIALEPAQKDNLSRQLTILKNKLAEHENVYALITKTNQVKTILPLEPKTFSEDFSCRAFADINEAITFAASLKPVQLPQKEILQKLTAAEISKQQKKLSALENDLQQANNAEEQKVIADTVMANIYQLQKGQTSAQLINIYDGTELNITLSPLLTPVENAQAYYKKYNKYKRAQTEIITQIDTATDFLSYLETLDISLLTADTKDEIEEIALEMASAGLLKENRKKQKSMHKSKPLHIRLNEHTDIYIGKNNKQNDHVTFTIGAPKDFWLHTKDIPGSHVILKTTLPEPDAADLHTAAQLAAYFSKARSGSNVPVDCTYRKYVKKPSGSKPGFVIFTNQKTYYITPDEAVLKPLLQE